MDRSLNLLGALALCLVDRMREASAGALEGEAPEVLVHLLHCHRPTIESLRQVLELSHSATVRLADRLERDGLVRREPADWDRRAVVLNLTPAGRACADTIVRLRNEALESLVEDVLGPSELEVVSAIAEKLLARLSDRPQRLYRICRLCDFDNCERCPVAEALR